MTEAIIKEKLRTYLSRSIKNYELKDDDNLFELGIVHSLFIIQLMMFVEKNFDIEIDDSIDIEEIKCINDICRIITQPTQTT